MSRTAKSKILADEEIGRSFEGNWGKTYPPVLSIAQASELLQISRSTIYEWIAKGRLDGCFRRRGKHIRLWRDKLIDIIFNGKEWS